MGCSPPPSPSRRSRPPAVATSLIAFIIVYFAVFGAGLFYILRLMAQPAAWQASPIYPAEGPIRAAGIMPAPAEALAAGE